MEAPYSFRAAIPEDQDQLFKLYRSVRIVANASKQRRGVELQVFKINKGAKRFYERHGFRIVCETQSSFEMAFRV